MDPNDHTNCTACHVAGIRYDHNPIIPDPKANLIALLEDSRNRAQAALTNASEQVQGYLQRHIHAMNQQLEVVRGTETYDRKGKQK